MPSLLVYLLQSVHKEKELTMTLLTLVCVYIITQLPTVSYAIYRLLLDQQEMTQCGSTYRFMTTTADTLTIGNSSVNFLIYYPSAVTFRKSMHQICRRVSNMSNKSFLTRERSSDSSISKTSYTTC